MSCPNPLFICPVKKGCKVNRGFHLVPKDHPVHTKEKRPHKGVDLKGATGDDLRSVADGVIERNANNAGGWGLYIKIKHDDGAKTLYAHMSKKEAGLTVGTKVTKGQKIGEVGATGGVTGPHLHFEYWPTGSSARVDPWPCIAQTGAGTGVYPNGTPYPGTVEAPKVEPKPIIPITPIQAKPIEIPHKPIGPIPRIEPIANPRPRGTLKRRAKKKRVGLGDPCGKKERVQCISGCKCKGILFGKKTCQRNSKGHVCPKVNNAMDGGIYGDDYYALSGDSYNYEHEYYPLNGVESDYSVDNAVYGVITLELAIMVFLMAIIGCILFGFGVFVYWKCFKGRKTNKYQQLDPLDGVCD